MQPVLKGKEKLVDSDPGPAFADLQLESGQAPLNVNDETTGTSESAAPPPPSPEREPSTLVTESARGTRTASELEVFFRV